MTNITPLETLRKRLEDSKFASAYSNKAPDEFFIIEKTLFDEALLEIEKRDAMLKEFDQIIMANAKISRVHQEKNIRYSKLLDEARVMAEFYGDDKSYHIQQIGVHVDGLRAGIAADVNFDQGKRARAFLAKLNAARGDK